MIDYLSNLASRVNVHLFGKQPVCDKERVDDDEWHAGERLSPETVFIS